MTKEELTTEISKILNEIKTTFTAYANAQNKVFKVFEVIDRFKSLAYETKKLFSEEEFIKIFVADLEEIQRIIEICEENHIRLEDIFNS
jgi:hypothetical protein